MAQPASMLHWVRGMLDIRRQHPVMGLGEFTMLDTDNEAVLAFLRHSDDAAVLCVMNLANTARAATITLPAKYASYRVTDLFGGAGFPPVMDASKDSHSDDDGGAPAPAYTVTLGSRDFFWLSLDAADDVVQAPAEGMPARFDPDEEPAPAAQSPLRPSHSFAIPGVAEPTELTDQP